MCSNSSCLCYDVQKLKNCVSVDYSDIHGDFSAQFENASRVC